MPSTGPTAARGVVQLLNTSTGGVLCLAGEVDDVVVEAFVRRYGREPVRVSAIDAGSATWLSASALELVRNHLDAAELAGRSVTLRRSSALQGVFAVSPVRR